MHYLRVGAGRVGVPVERGGAVEAVLQLVARDPGLLLTQPPCGGHAPHRHQRLEVHAQPGGAVARAAHPGGCGAGRQSNECQIYLFFKSMFYFISVHKQTMCVCVCERERERESGAHG